jgi:hypothetical protein
MSGKYGKVDCGCLGRDRSRSVPQAAGIAPAAQKSFAETAAARPCAGGNAADGSAPSLTNVLNRQVRRRPGTHHALPALAGRPGAPAAGIACLLRPHRGQRVRDPAPPTPATAGCGEPIAAEVHTHFRHRTLATDWGARSAAVAGVGCPHPTPVAVSDARSAQRSIQSQWFHTQHQH